MDKIAVLLLTCGRPELTLRTIDGLLKILVYYGEIVWYVADGGSRKEEHERVVAYLDKQNLLGEHSIYHSAGHNWNRGTEFIYSKGIDILLRLENDFELRHRLDISKYVDLLQRREDVGMVRLGLLPINLELFSFGDVPGDSIYLEVKKNLQYTFSGNPCLIHKRFHDAYGMFPVDLNPGDTELGMDAKVRSNNGPKVVVPWDLGIFGRWGSFGHTGEEKSIE